MTRVAVLDDWHRIALHAADWSKLPSSASVDVFHDHVTDHDALVERLSPYEVLVVMRERTPMPRQLVERLPKLKLIVTTSARNRSIDLAACSERGVLVCNTAPGHTPTAELTWGLILALAKRIPAEDRSTREGHWGVEVPIALAGRVLGLLGLGKLGSRVAAVGRQFDMEVIAWSQNLTAERARKGGATLVSKDELLSRSDFLSVHLVLGDRTRGLIGQAELERMKPTAYLINTSRGPIVDERALVAALEKRRIAGAGLDVFDQEPLPKDHPLRSLPNTVITPHLGGFVRENYELWYGEAVENVQAWLEGQPIRVLNPQG